MFDQLFDGFRKASESSIIAQQELLKQWSQQWPAASWSAAGCALERHSAFQKRWVESTTETLSRQRELLETICRTGMQVVEQSARISDAKSPDDYRQLVEELWRRVCTGLKEQSAAQCQALRSSSDAWLEVAAQIPAKAGL